MDSSTKAILGTAFKQVSHIASLVLVNVLIVRYGGLDLAGRFSFLVLMAGLVSNVLGSGVFSAVTYFIAGRRCSVFAGYKAGLALSGVYAAIGSVTLSVLLGTLQFFGFGFAGSGFFYGPLICVSNVFVVTGSGLLISQRKFRIANLLSLVQPISFFVAVSLTVLLQPVTCDGLLILYSLSLLVGAVLLLKSAHDVSAAAVEIDGGPSKASKVIGTSGAGLSLRMAKYGFAQQTATFLSLMNYRLDLFLVHALLGPSATALYLIAAQIAERLSILSAAASQVLLPTQAAGYAVNESGFWRTVRAIKAVVVVDALMAATVFIAAPIFLREAYGDRSPEVLLVLGVLLLASVANSPSRLLAGDFAARGKPVINTWSASFTLVLNLLLNLLLIPSFGIDGAALATLISSCANLVFRTIVVLVFERVFTRSSTSAICRMLEFRSSGKKMFY